jgi:outer membrane receptor protein involved in Fe transport
MKPKSYLFSILLVCSMLLSSAAAQTADQAVYKLGEVVVTGEMAGIDSVAISDTITAQEIEATNSRTVAEALKFAPGVIMTRGRKNEPEVSVHGFGQEKTLVLIDGIPYYETYYGKLNLDQIPAEIISKIEITKNAPSVLYGPNAQIAVINVVTRKGTPEPSFTIAGDVGEDDTYSASLSHGNQVGNINYWLTYVHRESDGWRLSDDFEPEVATRARRWMPDYDGIIEDGGLRENSDYETDKLWARIGLTPSERSEYFLSLHTIQSEFGHPPATNEYRIFTRRNDSPGFSTFARFGAYDDWGIDLSGRQVLSKALTLRGKLFYHDHEDEYVSFEDPAYESRIAASTYKDYLAGGNLIADFSLADWHEGHFSFHYRGDSHEARDDTYLPYNEYFSHTYSLGTEQKWVHSSGLSVFAGVSYDWFRVADAEDYVFDRDDNFLGQQDLEETDTTEEFNPMIGAFYRLDGTELYGSVARKTKFPNLQQLYSSRSGNPELDSEISVNYTAGVRHKFSDWLSAELAGFYHDISDWISRDYYEEGFTGDEIYQNIEEISMRGFETAIRIRPNASLSLQLDYTYNDAENDSSRRASDEVIGVPENKFGVGCDFTVPKILARLNLRGIYVDEMYEQLPTASRPDEEIIKSDDYFIVNARLSTKPYFAAVSAYAEVDNIFDEDYEQEIGFPGRGRNFRVGLKAEF